MTISQIFLSFDL